LSKEIREVKESVAFTVIYETMYKYRADYRDSRAI